jgi:hypothetical protein
MSAGPFVCQSSRRSSKSARSATRPAGSSAESRRDRPGRSRQRCLAQLLQNLIQRIWRSKTGDEIRACADTILNDFDVHGPLVSSSPSQNAASAIAIRSPTSSGCSQLMWPVAITSSPRRSS